MALQGITGLGITDEADGMSESLRHFPQLDPIPTNIRPEKLQAQAEIDAAVAEYLAKGGQIHAVDSSHNRRPQFIIGNVIKPER